MPAVTKSLRTRTCESIGFCCAVMPEFSGCTDLHLESDFVASLAPLLEITSRTEEAEHLVRDIQAFLGRSGAEVFPGWEVLPGEPLSPSVETMGRRLQVLTRLGAGDAFVIVATAQGATQLVAPPPEDLDTVELAMGR